MQPDHNPHNSPEASLEPVMQQEAVRNALLQLPDEQREVLTLRFATEMSHAEAVTQLGKSKEAIRTLQYRGQNRLRELATAPENPKAIPFR